MNARQLSVRGRVLFAVGVAVAMALESAISPWNWYSAGADYAFAEIFDLVVGWLLCGSSAFR